MTTLIVRFVQTCGIRARSMPAFGARASVCALGGLLVWGLGCSGDSVTRAQPIGPDSLYWALELNHHAVTLSLQPPYDTLTLAVTARTFDGAPLVISNTPQYSSPDLDRVQITADGVLHAIGLTTAQQPIKVAATLRGDRMTLTDTVLVRVVADTLPKLASLSIHPIPPDSAKTGVEAAPSARPFSPRVTDSAGAPIVNPLISIRSSDPSTIFIEDLNSPFRAPSLRAPTKMGTATLVASTTIFGVAKADTLLYQVGWPVRANIEVHRTATTSGDSITFFQPSEVRVGVGAFIAWSASVSDTVDVTFAEQDAANVLPADSSVFFFTDFSKIIGLPASTVRSLICANAPADCDGQGNALLMPERPAAFRIMAAPGTYEYHSTRFGIGGRIIVIDERP